ncbi:MAG: hypothetical protein ACRD3J_21485, partial [Thermoanaerobaculia bacterium]
MRAVRTTICLLLLTSLSLFGAEVLDNATVVRMVAAGLSPDLIVLKIERSQGTFDTTADALIALKGAHVPDAVITAMLLKGDAAAAPRAPEVPRPAIRPVAAEPPPVLPASKNVCATVKFYTTGNDGLAWIPSNVCVDSAAVTVDEQTIAFADVVAQCTSKASTLLMGGALLHGEQEWWIGDASETLKFRGKGEDLDQLAAAL